jgi:two-component system phosphate regulon sensor histidine kinase PhoR
MTLFKKNLLIMSIAALIFSAVLVVSALMFMNSLYYEVNTAGLRNAAKTLMHAIGEDRLLEIFADNDRKNIEEAILPVSADGAYRLTLILPSGYVLWDSHIKGSLVNHIDRREVAAALEGREGGSRRDSVSTGGIQRIYYALPVLDGNNKSVGAFRLSYSIPEFSARISSIIFPFTAFAVIMAIAVFWVIYAFSRSLSTSLGRLVNIAQAGASLLSGPEAGEPVAPEFRSLEKSIRAMTQELNYRLEQAKAEGCRLEAILNGMSEAVFAMDASIRLHLVNPCARKLFNMGDRDVKNMSLLEATRSMELEDAAKKALFGGAPLEVEMTFRTGAEQCFQVYASPLAGGGGVVLVLQEITRLVKLERVRKDFVANVSHELRTPIQLIKGFSETLLDAIKDGEKGNKKQIIHFIEIIRKNAGIMENLTDDLLILADLENNAGSRDMEELRVAPLIEEAVASVEPQAKRKQIEIITECADKLKADLHGSFIIQALINLIDNGIKYSPPKSKLWVSAFIESAQLVFEVRDKGIGIPAEHLERIFERFYRVDRARSREAGGTGLGLSIVRHIAMLHKGKAEAESHAGEGSVFRIKIPLG